MDYDVEIGMRELRKQTPQKKPYLPPFELLTLPEVSAITKLSSSSIYRMLNKEKSSYDPTFPLPLQMGKRNTRWRADEITKWLIGLKRGCRDAPDNAPKGKTPNVV
jgi:predicted DNA-binding transcriptional regulator AlpA